MPKPTAVLDTNIVDYAFKDRTRNIAADLLGNISKSHTLVISEYLRFEIYRGLAMRRVQDVKTIVDSFEAYPVSKEVLDLAAALATCYECDVQTKSERSRISDGDVILGATAFKFRFIIVSANHKDFPMPYFTEVCKHVLLDKSGKPIPIYELRPDVAYLNAMLDVCYPKANIGT